MNYNNPKFVASDEVRQDNIRAMSEIWKRWCDFNNIPKPFVEKFIEINQDYFRKL